MFNNKKDPLVDAVKGIMEASAREREIERKLNESLGITSKKALPHELHSEYDAVLKESIAGSQINEVSEKLLKRAKQKAKDNAMVAWELNDKKAEDKNEKRAKKFSAAIEKKKADGKKPSLKKKMEEEKKLSPKQEKLAALAGNKREIEGVDLKALRSGETLDEAKATEAQKEKVAKVMHKWKQGKEHIGKSDKTVPVTKKGQKQAVAIALSQAGLSKKMDESNSFNLVQEEIHTNLLERIKHIYESEGVDAANAYFETLSEEERGILGEQNNILMPSTRRVIQSGALAGDMVNTLNPKISTPTRQAVYRLQQQRMSVPPSVANTPTGRALGYKTQTPPNAEGIIPGHGPTIKPAPTVKAIRQAVAPAVDGGKTQATIRPATPEELKRPLGTGVAKRNGYEPPATAPAAQPNDALQKRDDKINQEKIIAGQRRVDAGLVKPFDHSAGGPVRIVPPVETEPFVTTGQRARDAERNAKLERGGVPLASSRIVSGIKKVVRQQQDDFNARMSPPPEPVKIINAKINDPTNDARIRDTMDAAHELKKQQDMAVADKDKTAGSFGIDTDRPPVAPPGGGQKTGRDPLEVVNQPDDKPPVQPVQPVQPVTPVGGGGGTPPPTKPQTKSEPVDREWEIAKGKAPNISPTTSKYFAGSGGA